MTGLAERIDGAWQALTPQEQRVAGFLRARPDESALYNSSELARLTGVSKATVSRLYRRLGFAASSEVRDLLRAQRGTGLPVVVEQRGERVPALLAQELRNLQRLAAELDPAALEAAAEVLAAAARVRVVGLRSGGEVAMPLRQALAQARPDVALVPQQGQSLGEELVGLTPRDAVVLVALRRRPAGTRALLSALASSPAAVVLVTEPGAPEAAGVEHRFSVPIESAGAFDSYAAASAFAAALADAVLRRLGAAGAARVADIDAAYRALGELEAD
ncbi:MurR/RpiR family transcriptional regulator [Amnibacterium endophyticum]|uniref:MurR/RpiR family transcriptional regulator n=1 Tax=Amnibacterium endophyticum TaxID=2109337 RepID=A0ABW4LFH7_9MICO